MFAMKRKRSLQTILYVLILLFLLKISTTKFFIKSSVLNNPVFAESNNFAAKSLDIPEASKKENDILDVLKEYNETHFKANLSLNEIYKMGAPNFFELQKKTSNVTVWMIAEEEFNCQWRFNYLCRFWYAVRCQLLGGFSKVRTSSFDDVLAVNNTGARGEDIILIAHRSQKHSPPPQLKLLQDWRDAHEPKVQIAVFHTANEINRSNWTWYKEVDFVLRNYWLPGGRFPPHVIYVPLHPQMPSSCTPEYPEELTRRSCSCGDRTLPLASTRRLLYSFSGSLRANRRNLINVMNASKVRDRGEIEIAKKFGGDGDVPKVKHLQLILDSVFVLAPCGNVMETHRIYEAFALGAIPLVEKCEENETSAFFELPELMMDSHKAIADFIENNAAKTEELDRIQRRILQNYFFTVSDLARNVVKLATSRVSIEKRWAP